VKLLTSAFAIYREPWILQQLKDLLELGDEDLDGAFPLNTQLHAFLDRDGSFGTIEADELIEEARKLWPELH
jgi:hypothetical protein